MFKPEGLMVCLAQCAFMAWVLYFSMMMLSNLGGNVKFDPRCGMAKDAIDKIMEQSK